jgi:hypothetical protein
VPNRVPDLLDDKIGEVSLHLDRLKAIRQFMHEDPAIVTELGEMVLSPEANGRIVPPRSGNSAENPALAKIVEYLRSQSPDDWHAVKDIEAATGVKRSLIYFILDRQHTDLFEVFRRSPKRKFWRLKRNGTAAR